MEATGDEGDRRNGADVEAAQVVLAPKIQALERRQFASAITGGKRAEEVESQRIALVVDGAKYLASKTLVMARTLPPSPAKLKE